MHIPEVDESDLVVLSEKGDIVVAPPDTLLEIAPGFLDVVVQLNDLRLVHADARQFLLNLFPSENAPGAFVQRSRGIGDHEHKSALVSS